LRRIALPGLKVASSASIGNRVKVNPKARRPCASCCAATSRASVLSSSPANRLAKALTHLGQLVKTIYILRFLNDPTLRQ
jgi:hypothetical protein